MSISATPHTQGLPRNILLSKLSAGYHPSPTRDSSSNTFSTTDKPPSKGLDLAPLMEKLKHLESSLPKNRHAIALFQTIESGTENPVIIDTKV